ncbi:MAG: 2-oxoglutarate dehydrogenase complex dihydrolipoyllysine-residue succinyltransferase, partial [Alphaproteobacteria bacterium]
HEAPAGADEAPRGAGPAARKAARESGVDLAGVEGTGPKGNVTKADVASARGGRPASEQAPADKQAPAPAREPAVPPPPAPGRGGEERVKMTRLRKRIAERLKEAQNTAAMLTTFNEVDMSAIMELRQRHQDAFVKKHGLKLGFMSFFVKAAIEALKAYPAVNAEIDGDEIVYKHYYDIGVAVSTESGLVVPVVRGADQMSFATIERTINELGQKARDGKLAMEDLMGGTFSISNGGVFGSMMSTPILNPPQVGILGMHKTMQRPMVMEDGRIEARPMMYLALSYDHRIIDGREAVSFLVRVKECIEDPERMLLDA